jgi:hypothetical protein
MSSILCRIKLRANKNSENELPCDTAAAAGELRSAFVSFLPASNTPATPETHQSVQILREESESVFLVTRFKCEQRQAHQTRETKVESTIFNRDREGSGEQLLRTQQEIRRDMMTYPPHKRVCQVEPLSNHC